MRKLPNAGKRSSKKRTGRTIPNVHTKLGIVHIPKVRKGKPQNTEEVELKTHRGIASVVKTKEP